MLSAHLCTGRTGKTPPSPSSSSSRSLEDMGERLQTQRHRSSLRPHTAASSVCAWASSPERCRALSSRAACVPSSSSPCASFAHCMLPGLLRIFVHDSAAHGQALHRVRSHLLSLVSGRLTSPQTAHSVATARRPADRPQRASAGCHARPSPSLPRPVHAEVERGSARPFHDRPQGRRNHQETIPLIGICTGGSYIFQHRVRFHVYE